MVPAGAGRWRFFRRPTIFPSFVRRIDFSLVLFSLFLIILRGCYNCSDRLVLGDISKKYFLFILIRGRVPFIYRKRGN